MKTRLPIVLSVPHGGKKIPRDAKPFFMLDVMTRLADGDAYTTKLFDFKGFERIAFPYARAFLDLNRHNADLPPRNPDGVFKTQTIFKTPVWRVMPDEALQSLWLNTYYNPYFEMLQAAMTDKMLGIDCHSMLAEDPFFPDKPKRPYICISNTGNPEGSLSPTLTAPMALMHSFKTILENTFGENTVFINTPFQGGHIIRTMHERTQKPWIQMEVNRSLYTRSDNPVTLDQGLYKKLKRNLNHCFIDYATAITAYEQGRY